MLRWSLMTVRVDRAAWTKPVTAAKCKMKYVWGVCIVVKRDLEMEQQKGEREAKRKTQRKTGGGKKGSSRHIKNASKNHQKQ